MNAPPRHRASPRQELAELTHARIMEAVAALLRSGSEDVTFDLVSRESGVPQRTVYRHFENKGSLFQAFWQWVNASIEMPPVPTTPEALVDHIPALFAAFERDEPLVRAMLHNPHGRAVRLAHAKARQEKFAVALDPIIAPLPADERRNMLAAVTVLCSATGWEMMKDNWRLSGTSAAEAAQWAVRNLIGAATTAPGSAT